MPHRYFVFTNVSAPQVRLAHDSGWGATALPGTDPQGRTGWVFEVPDTVPNLNGAQLNVDAEGKVPLQLRGVLAYSEVDPTRAYLQCDDFVLVDVPKPPEPPGPTPGPTPTDPLGVITAVYATGQYNLATQSGCGTFTEECAWQLRLAFGNSWGHIVKEAGQNQFNGHAVDAVQSLWGEYHGKWDIIVSSVSSSAHPAFNDAGTEDPSHFAEAFPPGGAANDASLAASLARLIRVLVHALGR